MTVDKAIKIVARQVARAAIENIEWMDYPEIGEYDWERVQGVIESLVKDPSSGEFEAAYELLEKRAESEMGEADD